MVCHRVHVWWLFYVMPSWEVGLIVTLSHPSPLDWYGLQWGRQQWDYFGSRPECAGLTSHPNPDSNVHWANIETMSRSQYRHWANVGLPTLPSEKISSIRKKLHIRKWHAPVTLVRYIQIWSQTCGEEMETNLLNILRARKDNWLFHRWHFHKHFL